MTISLTRNGKRRVVVTGMAGISPLGCDWPTVLAHLQSGQNAVRRMDDWAQIKGLKSLVAAPAAPFELSARYNRRTMRSMFRGSLMAVRATEWALEDAGLINEAWIHEGAMGVSYGACAGDPNGVREIASLATNLSTKELNATTYVRFMSHTAPVNIGVFFEVTGRVITTSSACTSGSQGIGYAYEAVADGRQRAMIAGGSEDMCPANTAVFDTLFAASTGFNDRPELTPKPFDKDRDGLVLGEGAGTLILEDLESALARGATIYAEVAGFATNSDGRHITNPDSDRMRDVMREALEVAGMKPEDVGYVNAHGTATLHGDVAESRAVEAVFGDRVPMSTLKGFMGHTLGACGALEAWMSIEMMRAGWFAPTCGLANPDPECGKCDYIMGEGRPITTDVVMSNNFAFGGVNTSLIFKRWTGA